MKRILFAIAVMSITMITHSQSHIRGSIQMGATDNTVDIMYMPSYSSAPGEYLNHVQLSIAIPVKEAGMLKPVIECRGNLTGLTFTEAVPFGYVHEAEKIFTWVCPNPGTVTTMSWTNGTLFKGAVITFTGGGIPSKVRLVDFSKQNGGKDQNTYFAASSNKPPHDVIDNKKIFIALGGKNGSTAGSYNNNDQYVETNSVISMGAKVQLLNFSGYKDETRNVLLWRVNSQMNTIGFEVQRSTDGINYAAIGFVNSGTPDNNNNSAYTFDDNSPAGQKQYYRLAQVDIDKSSKISNVVLIQGNRPVNVAIGGLFPNPASTVVNVIIDAPGRENVTLVLSDINGKAVKQQMVNVETGSNTVPVEISSLAQGSYMVKVVCKSECESAVAKFNKQ